jgi:PAS domain S-box-containing protein
LTIKINSTNIDSLIDTEALYQHAPCGYISFLPDGKIVKVNKTLSKWLKYNEGEIAFKKNFSDLISKGGSVHFELFFRPMINVYGEVKELSYEFINKEGTSFPVLVSAKAVKDAEGTIIFINAAIYDITDRKKFEKELVIAKKEAESEKKRFIFLADLVPEMIWTANPDGKIDYVNERFYQYFNISKQDLDPIGMLRKIHHNDRKQFLTAWQECFKVNEPLHITLRLKNAVDEFEWHLIQGTPYRDDLGRLIKWFGSCFNVDDHIKALQKKDEFINIASHELKTPVTSLKASLQMLSKLKSNVSSELVPKLIDQANRNIDRVTSLIASLLNASEINQGQLQLNKEQFDILPTLQDCCSHILSDDRHKIVFEGDLSLKFCGDEARICQVITNFITNAVKYAPESEVIKVKVENLDKNVKLSVIDHGPGISSDKQAYLFDRYYRVDSGGGNISGLGLGLYISAEIIRKHNGTIGLESVAGRGSNFWFTLPA